MGAIRNFFSWIHKIIRGDKILITFYPRDDLTYVRRISISNVSETQAFSMGFIRGYKMFDEIKYLPFKVYVRFNSTPSVAFPTETLDDDGSSYRTLETSSTLFDRFQTKSTEKFVKGMTKANLTGGDQKRLIMVIAIALAAVAGMALIFMK